MYKRTLKHCRKSTVDLSNLKVFRFWPLGHSSSILPCFFRWNFFSSGAPILLNRLLSGQNSCWVSEMCRLKIWRCSQKGLLLGIWAPLWCAWSEGLLLCQLCSSIPQLCQNNSELWAVLDSLTPVRSWRTLCQERIYRFWFICTE